MGGNTSSMSAAASASTANVEGGGCPVMHKEGATSIESAGNGQDGNFAASGCPVRGREGGSETSQGLRASKSPLDGGCPVQHKGGEKPKVYNVYAEEIDPTNMMPFNPNQEPHAQQKYPLTKHRVQSSIPKGGTESTWLYPSPQMFFNSLKRKGKGEDVTESDVEVIVAIHNNMNERTWQEVMRWEQAHGGDSKLLKFMGRPDELSPLARLKSWFGGPLPFDRHDWIILRPDGTEVRYIIDYYHKDGEKDQVPQLRDQDKVKSITMTVRPALDSFASIKDRVTFRVRETLGLDRLSPATAEPASTAVATEQGHKSMQQVMEQRAKNPVLPDKWETEQLSRSVVREKFQEIQSSCGAKFALVNACQTEEDCSRASIGLAVCMAGLLCPPEAKAFNAIVAKGPKGEEEVEEAYAKIQSCLDRFGEASTEALMEEMREKASHAS